MKRAASQRIAAQILILSIGFTALVIISGATVWLVRQSYEDSRWATHSQQVQSALLQLQLAIRRAESGQRGYMLTSDTDYLKIYQSSADAIPKYLGNLLELVTDNPEQVARAQSIGAIVEEKRTELRRINDLQISGQTSSALDIVRDPAGQAIMDRFVEAATTFRDAESKLLDQRNAVSRTTSFLLLGVSLTGIVFLIVLTGATLVLLRRFTSRLIAAQTELAEVNTHLEEKVAERTVDLTEANDELQRFAYIVSHDLRSPLVNIMGFTGELDAIRLDLIDEQAKKAEPDPRRAELLSDFEEALGFIKSSIGKMDRLIKAILDLSRAGRRDFSPQPLDLDAILGTLRDALSHQTQEVGAEIRIEPLPGIESDRVAIEQIFSNLLDNAVKYLRRDEPGRIVVSAEEKIGFAVIRVADNGRGIDPADRDRVFELFRRAGMQDRPGEGIGLAHVRALVRRLGGSIKLDSEPGKGSTFTVILPKRWKV
ncbi:histidine kinase [Kaistia algarum]|uniref:sensor histidine kinase n=1 Tax=Kaistia algarum TaxID=2083279 RepID=UPI000CE9260C|nr:CHASE3 domain-containing protein [Kaistia algarum]MCX5516016.1 CHASE3 domain-containing protein [Kaistia algarum]PPE80633.1 histidine kinase [Kaistia algarum]